MRKYLIIIVLAIMSMEVSSQIIWKSDLDSVYETGYHNIEIAQELIGGSKSKLIDLKIKDAEGVEIPYFLRDAASVREVSSLEDYPLAVNNAKDSLNTLVVKNESKESISRFYVVINKADVAIDAMIRGSNDEKQWYIVKQRSRTSVLREDGQNEAMIVLDFPSGNYQYYEVTFFNNQNTPLDVKGVKKLRSSHIYGKFSEVILTDKIKIETKEKETFIRFPDLENEYIIGKIEFFINSKVEYLRPFILKDTLSNRQLMNFDLSSKSDNTFYLFSDNLKLTQNTLGIINNQNNLPLSIDSVKIYGVEQYACAYLEKGKKYYMEVGRDTETHPQYDIVHFKNDISTDLPIIRSVNLSKIEKLAEQREQLLIEKPIFLWSIIIGIGVLLTVVSVSMVIKMKKREEE